MKHKIKYETDKQLTLKETIAEIKKVFDKFDELTEDEGGEPKA